MSDYTRFGIRVFIAFKGCFHLTIAVKKKDLLSVDRMKLVSS